MEEPIHGRKRKTLKRKILILISTSIIYPVAVFFICFFSLSSVTLPIIEWYYIAIIAAVIPDVFIVNALYKTWKEDAALRLVKTKSYEKGLKIALAIMSVVLCIILSYLYAESMIRTTSLGEKVITPQYGNISYLALAVLCAVGPIGFYEYFKFKKINRMEEKFPDFLRDLAEYWRGGLSMSAAITALAKTEYGALTKEVKKMATQISWGTAFQEVLKMFSERIRTRLIERSVSLIDEANRAGGRISDILVTASNDSREIKWLQIERKKGTAVYVIIVYVGFFVYLGIVGVLAGIFLPAVGGATKGVSSSTSLGSASISPIDVPFMCFIFFASALIQAVGNGIVGGLMSEGKIVAGLRHSFIMVLIAWLVFAGAIYPIAVDTVNPTSSVNSMSYWQTTSSFDITVSASDKMPGTGMGRVELFYKYSADNYIWSNWTSYDKVNESPWKFKFDSKTARGDGYYEFCSIAIDVAENKEDRPAAADAGCCVDTTPPTTTITINGAAQYWQAGNVTFTANISDKYAGINSTTLWYRYRANNATTEFGSWISLGTYNVSNIASPKHSDTHQWSFSWQDGEGIYQFKAEGVDCLGNKEAKDFDMMLGHDLTPPNSAVTAISSYWQHSAVFDVPYTASDNVDLKSITLHYKYSSDNKTWTTWVPTGSTLDVHGTSVTGNFLFTATEEGYYEFRTTAMDGANNNEIKPVTTEGKAGYDVTIPSSSVNAMPFWTNTNTTITINAYDDISDIKNVTLWYRYSSNNVTWWEECMPFGVDENPPWVWVFDFPNGVGYYEFYSTANDNALNYKDYNITPEVVCAYDSITPESEVNSVNYWQNTSTFIITANVSDNISGISSVELFYNYSSDNHTWNGWTNFGFGNYNALNNVWEWSFTAPNGNGYYLFYSVARDNATNIESAPVVYDTICAVDTTKPTISNTAPSQYISDLIPVISLTITDMLSGINNQSIVLIVNGIDNTDNATIVQIDNGYNITYISTIPFDDGQTVNVTINATDNVGNNLSYSWSFIIDISPPELEIITPSEKTVKSPEVWFNGSCSDDISGIQYVEINITCTENGSVIRSWTHTNLATNYTWWDYNFTLPYEGNYTVVVRAVDNASNVGEPVPIDICYNSTGKYNVYSRAKRVSIRGVCDATENAEHFPSIRRKSRRLFLGTCGVVRTPQYVRNAKHSVVANSEVYFATEIVSVNIPHRNLMLQSVKYDNIELTERFSFTLEFRTIATDSAGNVSPRYPKLDVKGYVV